MVRVISTRDLAVDARSYLDADVDGVIYDREAQQPLLNRGSSFHPQSMPYVPPEVVDFGAEMEEVDW